MRTKAAPRTPIEKVHFCDGAGNYAAFRAGAQVPGEKGNAWLDVLQDKLNRGVVNARTKVRMPSRRTPDHPNGEWTVGDFIKTGHLKARTRKRGRWTR